MASFPRKIIEQPFSDGCNYIIGKKKRHKQQLGTKKGKHKPHKVSVMGDDPVVANLAVKKKTADYDHHRGCRLNDKGIFD